MGENSPNLVTLLAKYCRISAKNYIIQKETVTRNNLRVREFVKTFPGDNQMDRWKRAGNLKLGKLGLGQNRPRPEVRDFTSQYLNSVARYV
jgi:hypothetical protein